MVRRGREAVGDFFATLQREVDFTEFAPRFFAATGNHVLVHVDVGYKLKNNGKAASVGSLHEFEVENGNVKSFRGYGDHSRRLERRLTAVPNWLSYEPNWREVELNRLAGELI